eukprot:4222076-Prymnesium_polylepis.1
MKLQATCTNTRRLRGVQKGARTLIMPSQAAQTAGCFRHLGPGKLPNRSSTPTRRRNALHHRRVRGFRPVSG